MKKLRSVVKVRLRKILYKTKTDYNCLFNSITNVNNILNIGYLFIRAYVLYVIENNSDELKQKIIEPHIDIDFIRASIAILLSNENAKKGRPFNDNKTQLINNLKSFFDIFKADIKFEPFNSTNVSYILGQAYEQMYISVINNIKYHFDKHVWKYLRAVFIDEYNNIRDEHNSDKLKEYYKQLDLVKTDLYENTLKSDNKYHNWITTNRQSIIPSTFKELIFEYDIEKNTFTYIKSMCFMTKFVQTKKLKSYQIFPIRSSCYLRHIKINTSALIDIFYGTPIFNKINKKPMLNKLDFFKKAGDSKFQEIIWNTLFKLKTNGVYDYKLDGFSFNYEIETDRLAVSLNFINNNEIINKEQKKNNFRKGRKETALMKKLSFEHPDEYDNYLKSKMDKKLKKSEEDNILKKQRIKEKKTAFAKLSVEDKNKLKCSINEQNGVSLYRKIIK
jgi:hypothetical protein